MYQVSYKSVNGKMYDKNFKTPEEARTFKEKLKGNKLCEKIYPISKES